ncbi:ovomucoid-like isoform X2 [Lemur catta]|uniref:ovomucoid-like isoform X2 n=1 Tax=Lemur catta TaxID=9447 RepID=UPI001E26DBDC|nr:ovomucoid-like isoform X2 [Lemur catta]XP_045407440.1 ovomucoid-like isoform X2 [Lemur catta]XP_045407441.1 ovomucoid-like isoform X2 [Lemur catta]XP_045407442.1 ovomucoid-like isoform X2 [Lemur catta]
MLRLDQMPLFSLWIKALFITLTLVLHSETVMRRRRKNNVLPRCQNYVSGPPDCDQEIEAICASNGKTYINECTFCKAHIRSNNEITVKHEGVC